MKNPFAGAVLSVALLVSSMPATADGLFGYDLIRYSWGLTRMRLQNPQGFDVSEEVYQTGESSNHDSLSPDAEPVVGLSFEKRIAREGKVKRLWTVVLDAEDYDGLELTNLLFGSGVAISPPGAGKAFFGMRAAAGAGIGTTRSETYFDEAWHFTGEIWVSAGVQLGRFVIDATLRERKAFNSTLDERSAGPQTRISSVMFGLLF